ncbi:MAG: LON peptidase substrate-binding domain-containing protein [Vicinamibacterales bacterium]
MSTPQSIPIFPLPTVVLFPHVFLPLHIFEPRYRQMVADALSGDRLIGMALLRPGYESDYEGRPPIYNTGCTGLITHFERLDDGRFNLILRGLDKFSVLGEEDPTDARIYRRALVSLIDESLHDHDRDVLRTERRRLEAALGPFFDRTVGEQQLPSAMPDEDFVNALAQYLEFDPIEKQALLERDGAIARCRSMVELLEMKAMLRKTSGDNGHVH